MAYSERFERALTHAAQLHRRQVRKGSQAPYIGHLLGVAAIAIDYGADEDEAVAALLHDAVEDQGGAEVLAEIREMFGSRVADIVDGCSDTDTIPKPPWRERKEQYVAHVADASPSVRFVSSADKLHNALSILRDYRQLGEDLWSRFRGGKEGTLWYYRALVEAYRAAGGTPVVDDLDRVVSALERAVADSA